MRRLHVRTWGEADAPAVVCLHGVTSWGGHFETLAGRLAPGHRVIAPDLLGHGESPKEPPWRIAAHLESIAGSVPPDARIWLGIHFRTADEEARRLGRRVAAWTFTRFLQPTHGHNGHKGPK